MRMMMIPDNEMVCKKCHKKGFLLLQMTVEDYICEGCGEWQDFELDSIYYPTNYKVRRVRS